MDNKSPIDVRIIVEGASDVESVSRAMQDVALGAEYHITISSIIPTTSIDIARKAVQGADVVLIATDVDGPGRDLAEKFQKSLKDEVGHLERMKFPYGHDVEYIDPGIISEEIKNAIIRAGLLSIANIRDFRQLEDQFMESHHKMQELSRENNNLLNENQSLLDKMEEFSISNEELLQESDKLKIELENIKGDYNKLNSQYTSILNKNLFEVFSITKLWREAFDEDLKDLEHITFAINQFKPDNIIVGQGSISARSKDKAIEWLKVIRTALIFMDPKSEELKNDLDEENDNLENQFQNIWE